MSEIKWLAISEAPRDGSWIISSREDRDDIVIVKWQNDSWVDMNNCRRDERPYFIPCPEFPKPKVMIDGNELLTWAAKENLTSSYTALLYRIKAMMAEAQK